MSQVLTLREVQRSKKNAGDEYGAAVIEQIIQECDLMNMIPWKTLGTTEIRHRVTDSIPTVGFRQGRGASFGTVASGASTQVTDAVYQIGSQIEMDKIDVKDKNAGDLFSEKTRNTIKGITWTFNDYFINGDHATDPHGFEGIKVRLANMASDQTVYGVSNSAELDVRASASPTEATLYNFLDKIDEAIDALDGHDGDVALTSSDFIATLRSVLRRLGKYTERPINEPGKFGDVRRRTSADKPSKPVLIYPEDKGLRWYDLGYKADQSTRIVGTDTVNSVACRPVYFVKLGHPYVYGIQQYALDIDGPNKIDDRLTYRTVIDWPIGLTHAHKKSISKLAGVRVA